MFNKKDKKPLSQEERFQIVNRQIGEILAKYNCSLVPIVTIGPNGTASEMKIIANETVKQ